MDDEMTNADLFTNDELHELEQARAAALTPSERQFLTFALDQAFECMVSDDGFTTDDWAALEKLRTLAARAPRRSSHA